jgi:AraC family transcriptional regulator
MLRRKVLLNAPGLTVSLCVYGPGERHAPHTDRHSRVSFLLAGAYREEAQRGSLRMRPGEVLLKSRRTKHEDRFGDEGASLAAIEFLDADPFEVAPESRHWNKRTDAFALRHATAFLEAARAGDANGAAAAGIDLVTASFHDGDGAAEPPAWLDRLRAELEDHGFARIDVTARARAAGVHPAHVSRLFRRCYRTSITEHANAHGVRRAMSALAEPGMSLGEAALAAGFYDQSHMTRVFRRVLGRTPGAQRALLTGALG